jgi:Phycobilisome degradation protein nblA
METLGELSLEQELELQIIKAQTQNLSLESAQEIIVEIMRQIIIRDNLVDHLLSTTSMSQIRYSRAISSQAKSFG